MEVEFTARRYEAGDENAIVGLLTEIFGAWPRFDLEKGNVDYWKWKYLDNPFKNNIVAVVETGGQLVGCHHRCYFEAKIGDNAQLICQAMDLGAHPSFRRMGVYNRLMEKNTELAELDEMKLTYWTTGNPVVMDINKRGGSPTFVHDVDSLIKVKDVERHFAERGKSGAVLLKYGFKTINLLKKIGSGFIQGPNDEIDITEITEFDDRINDYWEKIRSEYRFMIKLSPDYLN
ncbi:GNAT family N-acetyltransferase [Candidatus Bathyarchaeota archaeon]|nr:GNAT family N-acetyltransferase [Candidatus Bathyarchaeota archaeon]